MATMDVACDSRREEGNSEEAAVDSKQANHSGADDTWSSRWSG